MTPADLDGLIVGPDQWLVLSSRHPMTLEQAQRMRDQIPAALAGRVLIIDQMDMAAVGGRVVCADGQLRHPAQDYATISAEDVALLLDDPPAAPCGPHRTALPPPQEGNPRLTRCAVFGHVRVVPSDPPVCSACGLPWSEVIG